MRKFMLVLLAVSAIVLGAGRTADIAFRIEMIDPGANETAAVADFNNDGRLDIFSGDAWFEAPAWKKHPVREIDYTGGYIDNFSDLALDVDGDGYIDVIQFGYFSRKIVWLKNRGKAPGPWAETVIDSGYPTEFALLVDLDNDGISREFLPEFDQPEAPLAWYELKNGKWLKHVLSPHSYGHGIGAGDVNGDGRNDIITPQGWFEAPAELRSDEWVFHATDWNRYVVAASAPARGASEPGTTLPAGRTAQFGFMYALDINGDGRKDIVTTMAHDYGLCWFEQTADGRWIPHQIDNTWSQAHSSAVADLNGDGVPDLITGKRYMAHNGNDPGERDPIGLYWYDHRKASNGSIEWIRHIINYGERMGGGMQIRVVDIDGDGDLDVISGGKSGLFLARNLSRDAVSSTGRK